MALAGYLKYPCEVKTSRLLKKGQIQMPYSDWLPQVFIVALCALAMLKATMLDGKRGKIEATPLVLNRLLLLALMYWGGFFDAVFGL